MQALLLRCDGEGRDVALDWARLRVERPGVLKDRWIGILGSTFEGATLYSTFFWPN